MANLYRVFTPVDNVDLINKISTLATDVGLPNYVRSDRPVNDLLVFTCNTNQLVYIYIDTAMDVYIEPCTVGDDMTTLNLQNTYSNAWGKAITEVHMFGYDDPKAIYILMKRSDGVWMSICLGYCHPIGTHSGCFVASCSFCTHDDYDNGKGVETFPAGFLDSTSFIQQPMFGTMERWSAGAGYVNVDIGNGAVEHWHKFDNEGDGNSAVSPILYYEYNEDVTPQQTSFGYRKLCAARHNFGWNTHLMTAPFMVRDPDGYYVPVGYAPNIRAVRSLENTTFDKINSAGTDFWLFPMFRNTPYQVGTVSSTDFFWAFQVFAGQETPVLL